MAESHLEEQLLDHLQEFLLELGHGFCFEARQQRILIGDVHGFVDLVFYHRILKCHVPKDHALVEYALAGIDNHRFVSKYQLHLPDRDQLRRELRVLSLQRGAGMKDVPRDGEVNSASFKDAQIDFVIESSQRA